MPLLFDVRDGVGENDEDKEPPQTCAAHFSALSSPTVSQLVSRALKAPFLVPSTARVRKPFIPLYAALLRGCK